MKDQKSMQSKSGMQNNPTIKVHGKSTNKTQKKIFINRITKNRLFSMPYQEKVDNLYVYSDIPVKIRKVERAKEGTGYYETDAYQIVDPYTNKEISLIERQRIAKNKNTGYGAPTKIYLVRAKDDNGKETSKVSITEFDRNMNVLNESTVSNIPSQAEFIPSKKSIDENKLAVPVPASSKGSINKEYTEESELRSDIINSNFHQSTGIANRYKEDQIRHLARQVGVPVSSSASITINNIRDKLREQQHDFTDRTEENQQEMEELLK